MTTQGLSAVATRRRPSRPGQLARLRAVAARRPVAVFLAVAYPVFWLSWLPVLVLDASPRAATAAGVLLGLALPAFLLTVAVDGREGVRDLVARLLRRRAPLGWYVAAVLAIPVGVLTLAPAFLGGDALGGVATSWTTITATFLFDVAVALVTVQLFEELGWTGFVQHRLQARYGAMRATLLVAVAFAGLHLPTYLTLPVTGEVVARAAGLFVVALFFSFFFRALLTWAYNRTGFSVLLVALLHASFNEASAAPFYSHLGSEPIVLALPILVVTGMSAGVAVTTRGRLGQGSWDGSRHPEDPRTGH